MRAKKAQNPNQITRAIIDSTVDRCIREIDEDPKRSIRKLADMGRMFSRGRFLDEVYRMIQDLLRNDDSPYYVAIERLLRNTTRQNIKEFGINFGYNGITFGGKIIRELQESRNIRIPWALVIRYNPSIKNSMTLSEISNVIEQGTTLGIYCYMLRCTGEVSTADIAELCASHKDCSFTVFYEDQPFGSEDVQNMKACINTLHMFSVRGSNSMSSVDMLKKAKILYGMYDHYNDEGAQKYLSGESLQNFLPFQGVFTIIIADDTCSADSKKKVAQYCRKYRLHPEHPYILFDLYSDIEQFAQIISSEEKYMELLENGDIRSADVVISDFRHTTSVEQLLDITYSEQ